MRRFFVAVALLATLLVPHSAMAQTEFTYLTEQTVTAAGITTNQQVLPASVDCIDVSLVSSEWDAKAGQGTLAWRIERREQGVWLPLVGQDPVMGGQPLNFGDRTRSGGMPFMGICRTGLGAMVTRVVLTPSAEISLGVTGVAT